jgi:hypothetical protein
MPLLEDEYLLGLYHDLDTRGKKLFETLASFALSPNPSITFLFRQFWTL